MKRIDPLLYYQRMTEDNVLLSFNGTISQSILTDIALGLKDKVVDSGAKSKLLFSTFIELAQNILIHSEERAFEADKEHGEGKGIMLVKENPDAIIVASGNKATKPAAEKIKQKVKLINAMSPEELKSYYKEQRKLPHSENTGGGNIGLIEIVKKTGNPIEVMCNDMDEEHVFLTIFSKISK